MEQTKIIASIDADTHAMLLRLFHKKVESGEFQPEDFNDWIEQVLEYGLMISMLCEAGRVNPDVFNDVTSLVITSSKEINLN